MHPDLEKPGVLARLLRELPDDAGQPYGWSEFQRRARQSALNRRALAGGQALAALAVTAVGVVALSLRFGAPAPQPPRLPESSALPGATDSTAPGALEPAATSEARTEVLERWLASLPKEPAVVRVGTRVAVTGLEDRIAQVDDLLTAERIERARPAHLLALQQERVRLVSTLAQVRYAERLADESR
jgi:hypothetical protein